MKKNDIYLVGIILIIAIGAFIIINATKKDGDKVIIEVDNKVYKELPLDDANCPDKLCVDQKNAEYNGESIICLPNRVVVKVQSSKESSVDSIAN
ncbi:MAG: putative rane protein [Anaerocolumna sp.]|nr:putative rane protein [Anaerocolumna sp.]